MTAGLQASVGASLRGCEWRGPRRVAGASTSCVMCVVCNAQLLASVGALLLLRSVAFRHRRRQHAAWGELATPCSRGAGAVSPDAGACAPAPAASGEQWPLPGSRTTCTLCLPPRPTALHMEHSANSTAVLVTEKLSMLPIPPASVWIAAHCCVQVGFREHGEGLLCAPEMPCGPAAGCCPELVCNTDSLSKWPLHLAGRRQLRVGGPEQQTRGRLVPRGAPGEADFVRRCLACTPAVQWFAGSRAVRPEPSQQDGSERKPEHIAHRVGHSTTPAEHAGARAA